MKVPAKPKTYKARSRGKVKVTNHKKPLVYLAGNGEPIDVLLWSRYPSYDFIFGVPAKANSFYGKEAGFFQFRDTRNKKVREGFYVDKTELEDMVKGFTRMAEAGGVDLR